MAPTKLDEIHATACGFGDILQQSRTRLRGRRELPTISNVVEQHRTVTSRPVSSFNFQVSCSNAEATACRDPASLEYDPAGTDRVVVSAGHPGGLDIVDHHPRRGLPRSPRILPTPPRKLPHPGGAQ